jgi:predicted dehydrogenase
MGMKKLNAAIVGAGFVGRAHLESLRRLGINVQGVLSSSPERTKTAADSLGLPRAYGSLEELRSDESVQVAHLCTPNHLHFQESSQLLRAGKHVMCEKPLTLDSRESAALVSLLKETNLVGGVAYNLRYYPLCQEARALILDGAIGEVRLVHGSFLQDWLLFPTDWNWRLESKLGGELRAVSDIGTHWLDLMMWITGSKVSELCADLATVLPARQRPKGHVESFQKAVGVETEEVLISTEDYGSVLLHFENGARGVMTVSQVSAGRKARLWFEVNGSKASLAFDSESPNTLWIGRRERASEVLPKDPALQSPESRGYAAYPAGHAEGYPDTFVQLFKDFYSYIAVSDFRVPRSFPTFETGHHELVLCEAIAESAQKKSWVTVRE